MPGLGTSFGRGGATTAPSDLLNSDAILIMGSNMAENHPVGFQWVVEARERGTQVIHVDPRFSRTSAMANIWAPLRAGSDILFLGGLIHYVLENEKDFREYVIHYTNASCILPEDFKDTEDLDGVFSGWDANDKKYDASTWLYEGCAEHKKAVARDASAALRPLQRRPWNCGRSRQRRARQHAHPSTMRVPGLEETLCTLHA